MDIRNPDYPPSALWDDCTHVWEFPIDSMGERDVVCVKCDCPGERDPKTQEVYWPTT